MSFSLGSGIVTVIPLFILEASNIQFDTPKNEIFLSSSFKSYSNSLCITFKGLWGECSAKPISSKYIVLILDLFSFTFNISLAFSKIAFTPSEVLFNAPWYVLTYIFGYFWKNEFVDMLPFIALFINWTLKVLLHPGLPMVNIGIFVLIATNKENKFSNNALFFAIPFSNLTLSAIKFSSLSGIIKKSYLLSFLNISFNFLYNISLNPPSFILLFILLFSSSLLSSSFNRK